MFTDCYSQRMSTPRDNYDRKPEGDKVILNSGQSQPAGESNWNNSLGNGAYSTVHIPCIRGENYFRYVKSKTLGTVIVYRE